MSLTPRQIADSLSGEEREAYILSLQSNDTKVLMLEGKKRTDVEQAIYVKAKADQLVGKNAQCLKEDGTVDLNVRPITKEEAEAYEAFRRRRGAYIEEVRTAYLMKMKEQGKIHPSLWDNIETPHHFPVFEIKEKAEKAFIRGSTIQRVKDKFKEIMNSIFKPTHAEIMAKAMEESKKRLHGE